MTFRQRSNLAQLKLTVRILCWLYWFVCTLARLAIVLLIPLSFGFLLWSWARGGPNLPLQSWENTATQIGWMLATPPLAIFLFSLFATFAQSAVTLIYIAIMGPPILSPRTRRMSWWMLLLSFLMIMMGFSILPGLFWLNSLGKDQKTPEATRLMSGMKTVLAVWLGSLLVVPFSLLLRANPNLALTSAVLIQDFFFVLLFVGLGRLGSGVRAIGRTYAKDMDAYIASLA